MITTIQKWGNSYAVRLPKSAVHKFNLQEGLEVEIREDPEGKMLSIVPTHRRTASLKEMVAQITDKNRHKAVEWGPPRGKEIW